MFRRDTDKFLILILKVVFEVQGLPDVLFAL